jgi:hypothetical protein
MTTEAQLNFYHAVDAYIEQDDDRCDERDEEEIEAEKRAKEDAALADYEWEEDSFNREQDADPYFPW